MKKYLLISLLLAFTFSSCNKAYTYIQNGKIMESISAPNDSIAYLKAFEKFCISLKAWKDMKDKGMTLIDVPTEFKIVDNHGNEIIPYINKAVLDSIENRIMSLGNTMDGVLSESKEIQEQTEVKIDSSKIQKLLPLFTIKKDEFDPQGKTWIIPKNAPKYVNRNGMYCYFMKLGDNVSNFRFQIQYYADDWLFIQKYQFSIDGVAYEFIPNNVERDHDSTIWEWCDEEMIGSDAAIIKALSKAKEAKIKFVGRQYHKIRNISKKELQSIKNTVDLYIAMGGVL